MEGQGAGDCGLSQAQGGHIRLWPWSPAPALALRSPQPEGAELLWVSQGELESALGIHLYLHNPGRTAGEAEGGTWLSAVSYWPATLGPAWGHWGSLLGLRRCWVSPATGLESRPRSSTSHSSFLSLKPHPENP